MLNDKVDRMAEREQGREKDKDEQFADVNFSTTSGFFPEHGTDRIPVTQKVGVGVKKTAAVSATNPCFSHGEC